MRILFQGDSITDAGRSRTVGKPNLELGNGYVSMLCGKLIADNPDAGYEIINRGVSEDRIGDMYARWLEDAVRVDFDLISILAGINDVGFQLRLNKGSAPQRFARIYDVMLSEVVESHPHSKIVLIEPFIIPCPIEDGMPNSDIADKWELWHCYVTELGVEIKRLSEKYQCLYIPMLDYLQQLCQYRDPYSISPDCIHLTPAGNYILASRWLEYVTKERSWMGK